MAFRAVDMATNSGQGSRNLWQEVKMWQAVRISQHQFDTLAGQLICAGCHHRHWAPICLLRHPICPQLLCTLKELRLTVKVFFPQTAARHSYDEWHGLEDPQGGTVVCLCNWEMLYSGKKVAMLHYFRWFCGTARSSSGRYDILSREVDVCGCQ